MKHLFCVSIGCLLLLSLFFYVACSKKNTPKTNEDQNEVSNKFILEKAIEKFDEVKGVDSHKKYDISVRESVEEWTIYFNGKSKLPGDHAWIIINKRTDGIEYLYGQ
jgi:uncharacterized protein YcfL